MCPDTIKRTMTDQILGETQRQIEEICHPLDYQAFNRFHHGGKVSEQDLLVLKNCLEAGHREGRAMTALTEIIAALERSRAN
jgi:hypothetical protein